MSSEKQEDRLHSSVKWVALSGLMFPVLLGTITAAKIANAWWTTPAITASGVLIFSAWRVIQYLSAENCTRSY